MAQLQASAPISLLRRRMLDDMAMRGLHEDTQRNYIASVRSFAAFLGRSPETATPEDVRRQRRHRVVDRGGISLDGTRWVSSRPAFLLPVHVLGKLFRRLSQAEQEVATDIGPEAVIEIVASRLKELSRSVAVGKRIEAVVLTVPGLVRSDGFVVHLPILGLPNGSA